MWHSLPTYTVSPKCCYFDRGNTKSGFKMTSHSLSQKKEVGSLGSLQAGLCAVVLTSQHSGPGTAVACPWKGKIPASNFSMQIHGPLLVIGIFTIQLAFGWSRWRGSLVPDSMPLKCQKCSHCFCWWNEPDPFSTEARDILSVLEMTEDRPSGIHEPLLGFSHQPPC